MKWHILIIAGAILALGGCKPETGNERQSEAESMRRAAEMVAQEQAKREAAESRLREEESRTARWQTGAFIGFCGAFAALILGAILGSRAKHDADQQ